MTDQAYEITGEMYKGVLTCITGIFTLLGEDFFNLKDNNEKYHQIRKWKSHSEY